MAKIYSKPKGQTRWSSFENQGAVKGGGGFENRGAKGHAFDKISAGETISLLDYSGSAGIINRMWITINDRSPKMLRSLIIRMYWDGAEKPAVEAPIGDFFSCGTHMRAFESELFSSPEGRSFNTVAQMPFKKSAKITVTNESDTLLSHFFYDVNFVILDEPDEDAMYFHCYWNRITATTPGVDFEILPKVEGMGRFIGTNITLNANPAYGMQWWGEGEVKVYLDGDDKLPTLCGTGSEDYIGTAWAQGEYNNRYQGCTVGDWGSGLWIFYRLHVADPIWFKEDIKFTIQLMGGGNAAEVAQMIKNNVPLIPVSTDGDGYTNIFESGEPISETGWANYYRSEDCAATAWFYLDKAESNLPAIISIEDRIHDMREPKEKKK